MRPVWEGTRPLIEQIKGTVVAAKREADTKVYTRVFLDRYTKASMEG